MPVPGFSTFKCSVAGGKRRLDIAFARAGINGCCLIHEALCKPRFTLQLAIVLKRLAISGLFGILFGTTG